MKYLRQYIRQILLEKGELRRQWAPGTPFGHDPADVEIKKWFHKNADQQSLQQLQYVHWGTAEEIDTLLNASSKDEINTSIHAPGKTMRPWSVDQEAQADETVGLLVKGWVTFAGNVDLESSRLGNYIAAAKEVESGRSSYSKKKHSLRWHDANHRDRAESQRKSSGVPKRPSVKDFKSRVEMVKIRKKVEDRGVESLTPREKQFWEERFGDLAEIPGKDIESMYDMFILKKDDFVRRSQDDWDRSMENISLNWPEAIIDNWKPVAIVVGNFQSLGDDLPYNSKDYQIPIVDLDLKLYKEYYEDDFEFSCGDLEYMGYEEDDPEYLKYREACEEDDMSKAFPWLKRWI